MIAALLQCCLGAHEVPPELQDALMCETGSAAVVAAVSCGTASGVAAAGAVGVAAAGAVGVAAAGAVAAVVQLCDRPLRAESAGMRQLRVRPLRPGQELTD
jgi:Zn-dependent alcohol dehydrogenase